MINKHILGSLLGLGIPTMIIGIIPLVLFLKGMIIGGIISGVFFLFCVFITIAEVTGMKDVVERSEKFSNVRNQKFDLK